MFFVSSAIDLMKYLILLYSLTEISKQRVSTPHKKQRIQKLKFAQFTFVLSQSPGIRDQNNKGYIWPFYPLKTYIKKYFLYNDLFTFEDIDNIRAWNGNLSNDGAPNEVEILCKINLD